MCIISSVKYTWLSGHESPEMEIQKVVSHDDPTWTTTKLYTAQILRKEIIFQFSIQKIKIFHFPTYNLSYKECLQLDMDK